MRQDDYGSLDSAPLVCTIILALIGGGAFCLCFAILSSVKQASTPASKQTNMQTNNMYGNFFRLCCICYIWGPTLPYRSGPRSRTIASDLALHKQQTLIFLSLHIFQPNSNFSALCFPQEMRGYCVRHRMT